MAVSFQSACLSSNTSLVDVDHNYCSDKSMSNNIQDPEMSGMKASVSNNVVNNVDVRGEGQWRVVSHKRGAPSDSAQVKKQRQTSETIKLDNSFSVLSQSENGVMDDTDEVTQANESKPPPIFISNVTNVNVMIKSIETVISKKEYVYKCNNDNKVKISTDSIDNYRKLVKHFTGLGVKFYTYQTKQDRSFRVVIKNMHYSTDINDLKNAVECEGFSVRNIVNARHFKTKTPMSMFFVDLEPNPNNKDIYHIQYLLNAKITIEPPITKKEIVQCKKCQMYGHTKSYCWHEPRCVKCGNNHESTSCGKLKDDPPTCALCNGNHPANYKGCTVYKDLKQKSYPPLRQKKMDSGLPVSQTEASIQRLEPKPGLAISNSSPTVHISSQVSPALSYAQAVSEVQNKRLDENGLTEVIMNFFEKFEKLMFQQAQQMGSLLNLLTTVISKLK